MNHRAKNFRFRIKIQQMMMRPIIKPNNKYINTYIHMFEWMYIHS